jgi:hypothetical protein
MLALCKVWLRIVNAAYDDEINVLIASAGIALLEAGIVADKLTKTATVYDDELVRMAVIIWVKWHFGWNNPDAERLEMTWNMLLKTMACAGDYVVEVVS